MRKNLIYIQKPSNKPNSYFHQSKIKFLSKGEIPIFTPEKENEQFSIFNRKKKQL